MLYLHKDEAPLLNYIKNRLNLGKVYVYDHFGSFTISDLNELLQLIKIFEVHTLNTIKYLNFLAFKKALELYCNYRSNPSAYAPEDKEQLFNKLTNLKISMNKKRTDFDLPENHKIIITHYWLLGFIEGEGSFNVAKTGSFRLEFSISQTIRESLVLKAIQKFLLELPGEFKLLNSKTNPVQLVLDSKAKNERSNPMARVISHYSGYINNVLIPFLDKLEWLSKKKFDYKDWKLVLTLKQKGWHLSDQGKEVI